MTIELRAITAEDHLAFLDRVAAPGSSFPTTVSFLQTPAWARVKSAWRGESLGWYESGTLIGAGLVLYRPVPRLPYSLAYLPEGPVLDWTRPDVVSSLKLLAAHVRKHKAFTLRIGPTLVHQIWGPETIKAAIADPAITKLSQTAPDHTDPAASQLAETLRAAGWRPPPDEAEGFSAGQPKFNFVLPLTRGDRPATEDELLTGMNQLWRRNIKKAEKSGVEVRLGSREELADFHRVYLETAERDHFTGRPLSYFQTMWDALRAEDPDRIRLYLAHHEGDLVAATTWVRVGRHAWYSYGASTNAKRDVRGSNAIQWQMIRDALAAGAQTYDLRGITEGVGADDPEIGLIQFKVGTGGQAVSYIGEWDLPLNKILDAGLRWYLGRRR